MAQEGRQRDDDPGATDAAASWAARRTDPTPLSPGEAERFSAWLAADPAHGRRLSALERAWRDPHLAAAARGAIRRRRAGGRRWMLGGMAAALAGGAWLGRAPIERGLADHASGIGEVASVRTGSGTTFLLDTASALSSDGPDSWRLLQGAVRVDLLDGARLALAGGEGLVAAQEARFTLRRYAGHDRVAVLDGTVRADGVPIPPGHAATLGRGAPRPARLGLAERDAAEGFAEAWHLFQAAPLAGVLAELGRYRAGPVLVAEAAGRLRVSGRFRFVEPEGVLAALAATLPIRLQRLGPVVRVFSA